ncbi:MAG: hypothetical protein ACO3K7_04005 [Candidatus Marinamargulisbacteria bacterium]
MMIGLIIIIFGCLVNANQSFTPDIVDVWVEKIVLSEDMSATGVPMGNQVTLYECASKDCMLRVSDSDALSVVNANHPIPVGEYRYLTVTSCSGTTPNYPAKVSGTVTMGGAEYYTHSNNGLKKKEGSEASELVSLSFSDCVVDYELHSPIQFTDAVVTPLGVFVDTYMMASGHIGESPHKDGCMTGDDDFSVCLGAPRFIPMASHVPPTVARYDIKDDTTTNLYGRLVVFLTGNNIAPLGGFFHRYYDEALDHKPGMAMAPIARMVKNTGNSYDIYMAATPFNAREGVFIDFKLGGSHTGKYRKPDGTDLKYSVIVDTNRQ